MKKFTIFFSFLLLFTFFFVGSSYATELPPYPDFPSSDIEESNYIYSVHNLGSTTVIQLYVIASNNSLDGMKAFVAGENMTRYEFIENPTDFYFYAYTLDRANNVWDLSSKTQKSSTDYIGIQTPKIHYSSVNIYESKESNSIFFPLTPVATPTLEEIIAKEVPVMANKVVGTMKIILLCGVGCLALVISFPLFGKVFRIFQVK